MKKPSRNDPCPCGSGKKYKQCCQPREEIQAAKPHVLSASASKAIQAALAHYQAGRLHQAEAIYQQILHAEPNHPDALHLLGLVANQMGRSEVAIELISKAVSSSPSSSMYYNLGHVLQAQGKPDEAVKNFRKALSLKPDYAEAHSNLGLALQAQGKLDEAIASYHKALSIKPGLAEAHSNLGNALKEQDKLDEAIESYNKALSLKPDYAEVYNSQGNIFKEQGKLDAAVVSYRRALSLKPDFAQVHSNLGLALHEQGKLDEAADSHLKAISLKPDYAEAHYNLGVVLQDQDKSDAATKSYHKALSLKPDYAKVYNNLGVILHSQDKLDMAIEQYHKALSIKPGFAEAYAGLSRIRLDLGQFDIAHAELSRALESEPEHPTAWAMLAELRKMILEDEDWLKTALRLVSRDNPALSVKETFYLQFAIGKYYDDTQQYDLAFSAYEQANRLKRQVEGGVDRTGFSQLIDALIATYTADFIRQRCEGASQSQRPVLIVGMPRSGTSLTEQIIASHPDAFGAGELSFWGKQVNANQSDVLSGNYDSAFIIRIANEYEQHLQQYSTEATRIVDKMPDNFRWLGLINMAFPQARIIHMQRNPVDTCLSIYFQNFNSAHSYATDLDDLAFYYREYARLMSHWRNVLPADRFIDVPYEALTGDQARWSRRIIEFIGLDWDERCLDFYKTERKVGTASNWQVRQKIYHTSKARWRHYEKHLGPLLGLLALNIG